MKKDGRPRAGFLSQHRAYVYTQVSRSWFDFQGPELCVFHKRPFEKTPFPSWSDKALATDLWGADTLVSALPRRTVSHTHLPGTRMSLPSIIFSSSVIFSNELSVCLQPPSQKMNVCRSYTESPGLAGTCKDLFYTFWNPPTPEPMLGLHFPLFALWLDWDPALSAHLRLLRWPSP